MMRIIIAVSASLLLSSASLQAKPVSGKPAQTKPASKPQTSPRTITSISVLQVPTAAAPVRVHLVLSRPCDVALSILPHVTEASARDPFGWPGSIAKVVRIPGASAGRIQVPWDGKDDAGRDVLSSSPCVTVNALAGADRASICFRPILKPCTEQTLTLIPQQSGNVFAPGETVQIAAQATNVADRTGKVTITATPSGQGISAQTTEAVEPCPGGAATVLLNLGSSTAAGTRKVAASLNVGGKLAASASTSVTIAGPTPLPKSAEPVFGLVGLANPALVQAVGAGLWVGGRHWWENAELRGPSQPVPDAPDAVVADANKRGILLVGSAPSALEPSTSLRAAASHFIRRAAGWLLPYQGNPGVPPQLYAEVKQVHKDALALSPFLSSEEAEALAQMNPPADGILFRSACDRFPSETLIATRDASAPGKELWAVVGGPSPMKPSDALRGAVLNLVGGADRVLWLGPGGIIGPDGSAGPALAGCAFASQLLTGAEYAGRLRTSPGVYAYAFRKAGRGFVVAWCASGSAAINLQSEGGKGISVRDATGSKIAGSMRGSTAALGPAPLVFEGVAASSIRSALSEELAARAQAVASLASEIGIPCPSAQSLKSPDQIDDVRAAAVDAYASASDARLRIVSLLCKLEQAADTAVLLQALGTQGTEAAARRALDAANHAIADLRAPIVLKEGPRGYLPHARVLLRQAEKRSSAALTAYKQQDYAVAAARANQATSLAKALVKLVASEPVWDLTQAE